MITYRDMLQARISEGSIKIAQQLPLFATLQQDSEIEATITLALSRFAVSASALNSFLECRLKFYYLYIIGLTLPERPATAFGSAVHYALENYFKQMQLSPEKSFGHVDELIGSFKQYMFDAKQYFEETDFGERLINGEKSLREYHQNNAAGWNKIVSIEKFITGVQVNSIPLKGKVDKMEFDGHNVQVVDYKTGRFTHIQRHLLPPGETHPNGGDYWRQAAFYKLLIDHIPGKSWVVTAVQFDLIGGENKVESKKVLQFSRADLTTVVEQIKGMWTDINNRQFYTGCGMPECIYCKLSREDAFVLQKQTNT